MNWTPTHQQALDAIHEIASKHFDHAVIAVTVEAENSEDDGCVVYEWIGGRIPALGLAVSLQEHLKFDKRQNTLDEE